MDASEDSHDGDHNVILEAEADAYDEEDRNGRLGQRKGQGLGQGQQAQHDLAATSTASTTIAGHQPDMGGTSTASATIASANAAISTVSESPKLCQNCEIGLGPCTNKQAVCRGFVAGTSECPASFIECAATQDPAQEPAREPAQEPAQEPAEHQAAGSAGTGTATPEDEVPTRPARMTKREKMEAMNQRKQRMALWKGSLVIDTGTSLNFPPSATNKSLPNLIVRRSTTLCF